MVLLAAQNAFAANFNITPYGTLPTSVISGQTVPAYFTVTNMTNTERNGNVVQGLPATVTQNTTAPNCGNPINLGPYPANCQLQLDITGAVSSSFAICKGNSCTTATTPLNVSVSSGPQAPRFAYVTQNEDSTHPSVIVCPVDSSTGFLEGASCVSAGGGLSNISPQGIQISNDGSTAYITSDGTSFVYQCSINSTTGQFEGNCSQITPSNYSSNTGGFVALNSDNTLAYLPASNNFVTTCDVINNQIQPLTCVDTGTTLYPAVYSPIGIAINSTNSVAFIGNGDGSGQVATCDVSGSSFTSCTAKTGGGAITFTEYTSAGVALNNNGNTVYITNYASNSVYGCDATSPVTATTFNTCVLEHTITGAWGITLNAANTMAYVTDYDSNVYACSINQSGMFTSCPATTGFTFDQPVDIAFLY